MNIYLPIEVKVRELEGKTLLAMVAAERGHTVILGEKKDTLSLAIKNPDLPPGVLHDKSLTPGKYKIENFTKLKQHGHIITAQDEESGLLDESFDAFAKRRFSDETVSMVDKIFTWGPHDTQSLKKIFPEFSEKIISTGSPRVDFWRSEFDNYYKDDDLEIKPYIFIASNFGYPIDENLFWNKIARLRKAGYFERDPEMERYMFENTAYQYRLLYEFIEMIRELSKVFPNTNILVRPHPVESIDAWHKLLGEIPNVIIERKGTISGWIRNAAVLIHNGCTSAIEAAVSGLPRIAYRPIPDEIEREIPNKTSLHAFSLEELKKMVFELLKNDNTKQFDESEEASRKIINERLSSISDRFAAEKIVSQWEMLADSGNLKTSSHEKLKEYKIVNKANVGKKLKWQAVKIRNAIFGTSKVELQKKSLLKSSHKFPDLSDEEMFGMIGKMQNTLNRFQDVRAVRFGEKSFIFFTDK